MILHCYEWFFFWLIFQKNLKVIEEEKQTYINESTNQKASFEKTISELKTENKNIQEEFDKV